MIPELGNNLIKTLRPAEIMQFSTAKGNSGGAKRSKSTSANPELVKAQANQVKLTQSQPLDREALLLRLKSKFLETEPARDQGLAFQLYKAVIGRSGNVHPSHLPRTCLYNMDLSNLNLEGLNFDQEFYHNFYEFAKGEHDVKFPREEMLLRFNFPGANLKNTQWQDLYSRDELVFGDLTAADLSGANFSNCRFPLLNASQADLSNTSFVDCNFYGSNLTKSNLANAIFDTCSFDDCNFSGANLSGIYATADLGTDLTHFDLSGAFIAPRSIDFLGLPMVQDLNLDRLLELGKKGLETITAEFNFAILEALQKVEASGEKQVVDFSNRTDLSALNFYPATVAKALLGDYKQGPDYERHILDLARDKLLYIRSKINEDGDDRGYQKAKRDALNLGIKKKSAAVLFEALQKLPKNYQSKFNARRNANARVGVYDALYLSVAKNSILSLMNSLEMYAAAKILKLDKLDFNFDNSRVMNSSLRYLSASSLSFANAQLSNVIMNSATCEDVDFNGALLSRLMLGKVNLPGANFAGANLQNLIVSESDLSESDFSNVNFARLVISDCNLDSANFQGLRFTPAERGYDPYELPSRIVSSDLTRANFAKCDLSNLCFEENQSYDFANFSGANLSPKSDLSLASFVGTNFENATLDHVNLERSKFTGTNFKNASLRFAFINNTEIKDYVQGSSPSTKVDFSGADMSSITATRSKLSNAKLDGANLYQYKGKTVNKQNKLKDAGAVFERTSLTPLDCQKVGGKKKTVKDYGIKGSNLSEKTLTNKDYSTQDMTDVDLSRSMVSGGNWSAIKLVNANCERTVLRGINMSNALIDGCNLTSARFEGETNLSNAVLRNLDLTGTYLDDSVLFKNTAFFNCKFPEGFDLETRVENGQLVEVDEAYLRGLNFKYFPMEFFKTELHYDLRRADMRGAILARFNLGNCFINRTTKFDKTTNFNSCPSVPRFLGQRFGEGQRFTIKGER